MHIALTKGLSAPRGCGADVLCVLSDFSSDVCFGGTKRIIPTTYFDFLISDYLEIRICKFIGIDNN